MRTSATGMGDEVKTSPGNPPNHREKPAQLPGQITQTSNPKCIIGLSAAFERSGGKRRKIRSSKLAKSYFDTICDEEVSRISMWMSEMPMPPHWHMGVRYKNLNEFMSVSSRLHDIAREMLPNDSRQNPFRVQRDSIDSSMPVLSRAIGLYKIKIGQDLDVLRLMPRLRSLRLDLDWDVDAVGDLDSWNELMNSIRMLPLQSLSLDWDAPTVPPNTLLDHCKFLRELYIDNVSPPSFSWEVFGNTLEVIHISYASNDALLGIGQHCRLLKDVLVSVPETDNAYIDLLVGYTDKLRKAEVADLSFVNAQRLLDACPNVQLKVTLDSEWTMEAMEALRERTYEVDFYCEGTPAVQEVANYFSKVTKLYLGPGITHYALRNKKQLQELFVVREGSDRPYEIVKTIAESMRNLRDLAFKMDFLPPVNSFKALFLENHNLDFVSIEMTNSSNGAPPPEKNVAVIDKSNPKELLKYFADVIRQMYCLDRIEVVVLRSKGFDGDHGYDTDISDACVPFRHRPMHVNVLQFQYLPLRNGGHW